MLSDKLKISTMERILTNDLFFAPDRALFYDAWKKSRFSQPLLGFSGRRAVMTGQVVTDSQFQA